MKISVIIPTYNRAKILPLALESLVKQDYDNADFEIGIVDNNSKDTTKDVVEKYINDYPHISIHYVHEPNQGLVHARHAGARQARYEILAFTDDDGIVSPNWLTEINRVFEMDRHVSAVGGKITIRWDQTPPDWVIPYESLLGKLDYGNEVKIEKGLFIWGGNFSIRKTVLFELGGFNPDQIGDWLIGDGEVGLCRKLHNAGCLIGWAPDALMEHYQQVTRNATVEDIKRRFINNGRCVPYNIFAIEKKGTVGLLKNMIPVLNNMRKVALNYIIHAVTMNTADKYNAIFQYAFYAGQISYTFRLFTDRKFRMELLRTDWL